MIANVTLAALAALGVAAVVCGLIARNAARLGLVDVPNARSSHRVPTPRGGGIGIAAGVAVGVGVLVITSTAVSREWLAVIGGFLVIALLGAMDDLYRIPAIYRLVAQAVVAAGVVTLVGSLDRFPLPKPLDFPLGPIAAPLTLLWILTVTNFFNFMDGLDGLAGGQSVASSAGVAIGGWSVTSRESAIVLMAATIGFLLFNIPRARLFLGDVGSTSLGFLIATLPLLAPQDIRPIALFAVALGLTLFLIDPLETLMRRARNRHPLGLAHRDHSYQQLASRPRRHRPVVIYVVTWGFVLSVGGALALNSPWFAWTLVALGLGAFLVEKVLAVRTETGA